MGLLKKGLEIVQLGEQTAVGTAVPATWQLAMPMEFSDISVLETPPAMTGEMMANASGHRTALERATAFTIPPTPVNVEDLKTLLHFALDKTPTTDGTEVEATAILFAHAWVRGVSAVPTISGMTIEHAVGDGSTDFDSEYADGFITQFTIAWDGTGLVTFGCTGICQARADSARTDLSTPFPHNDLAGFPSQRANFFIDDVFADRGTTGFPGKTLGGSITVDTGLVALRPADASTTLGYSLIETNGAAVKAALEINVLAEAGAAALYRQEQDKAEGANPTDSAALRTVRMRFNGAPAATGSVARNIQFSMSCRHVPGSYLIGGDDGNGNQMISMSFESHPDRSATSWFEMIVHSSDADNAPATT